MVTRVKQGPILIAALLTLAVVGYLAYKNGLLEKPTSVASSVPEQVNLPQLPAAAPVAVSVGGKNLPGNESANVGSAVVKVLEMAWNADTSTNLAAGGKTTKRGSLMQKYGVNVDIGRQDDCGHSVDELVAMAKDLFAKRKRGDQSEPDQGVHFVNFMGDAGAAFAQQFKQKLKGLPPEYQAEIVGFSGFSAGEDQFMGPRAWFENPELAKGGVVICVKEDGDCNIVIKWAGDNQICLNADPATYDPACVNIMYPDTDFIKTTAMFNARTTSKRLIKSGPDKGKSVEKFADGLSTWTPADEQALHGPRGRDIVTIVSTKNYSSQMPAVFFGIKQWDKEHAVVVESFLRATFEAADQINASPAALHRAAQANAEIWGETAEYWERYFKGDEIQYTPDGKELRHIGGSSVAGLAKNLVYFGLAGAEYGRNKTPYQQVYEGFGDRMVRYYPDDVPSYPNYEDAVNTTYLKALQQEAGNVSYANALPTFTGKPMKPEVAVSHSTWHINFATGSAVILRGSMDAINEIARQAIEAESTVIRLDGHTDDVGENVPGGHERNIALSRARAESVQQALHAQAPRMFPDNRFTVEGHGYSRPKIAGTTKSARAENRRVEVAFGQDVNVAQFK